MSTKLTSIFVTSSRTGETARLPEECRTNTPSILSLKFLKKFPFTHSLPRGRSHTLNQFQIPSLPFKRFTSQTSFYVSFFQTSTRNERRKKRKQLEKFIKYKLIYPLSSFVLLLRGWRHPRGVHRLPSSALERKELVGAWGGRTKGKAKERGKVSERRGGG